MERAFLYYSVFVTLIVSIAFISCNKDDDFIYNPQTGDVYVAGYIHNAQEIDVATVWKNGKLHHLTDGKQNACANSVYVSGGDVYVAGYESYTQEINVAKLWKNGKPQNLTEGTRYAAANSVFVSDGNVYVAGYEASGQEYTDRSGAYRYIAKLWKNGVAQNLTDGTNEAQAKCVFVSGSDVYVAGYERNEDGNNYAKVWINGVVHNISDNYSMAFSVFVSDNNIYVGGSEGGYTSATVWTNGISQILHNGTMQTSSSVSSIFVSAGDIYVVGTSYYDYHSMSSQTARLWKNDVEENYSHASFSSVYVSDSGDVYVAGRHEAGNAVLWKNGIEQNLSEVQYSRANSVFVLE